MDNQQPSVNSSLFYQHPQKGYGFIYRYTSPSGKSYIGQTVNTLKSRAVNLFTGIGYKKCSVFWAAILKYQFKNFLVEILEECPIEELNKKEQYYIRKFNSLTPNGYNLSIGGEGGKTKEVFVYSAQNGEFIEYFSSLTLAAEWSNVPIETISCILKQEGRKQAHNLVFLDHYVDHYDLTLFNENKNRQVYVYDKDGFYLTCFNSIANAAKELNIGESSIRKCLSGINFHASYYQFTDVKYDKIKSIPKNSKSPVGVLQIDPETNEIVNRFPSYAAAARAVGLSSGAGIKKVISRGKGLSAGFFWKIDEGSTTKSE